MAPSVKVVINGGEIAYSAVERAWMRAGRCSSFAGSGRTADELAAAARVEPADERAIALAKSGLVQALPAEDPAALARTLAAALGKPATGAPGPGGDRPGPV